MNPVTNALSRVEIHSVHLGINYEAMAAVQRDEPETAVYCTAFTNLMWKDLPIGGGDQTILCDVSTGLLFRSPSKTKYSTWPITSFGSDNCMSDEGQVHLARHEQR